MNSTSTSKSNSARRNAKPKRRTLIQNAASKRGESSLDLALANIARFGDTDVVPPFFERHVFADRPEEALHALRTMDEATNHPHVPSVERLPLQTGWPGLRNVCQLDPVSTACYLETTLRIAPKVEHVRAAWSYGNRFAPELASGRIFARGNGYKEFIEQADALASMGGFVVTADIQSFYQSIPHGFLEAQLRGLVRERSIIDRTMRQLRSYGFEGHGLPVGGPASRILAEVVLALTDQKLEENGIAALRFADDYRLFATTENEAFRAALTLSDALSRNGGFALNRAKTVIESAEDYLDPCVEDRSRRSLIRTLGLSSYSSTTDDGSVHTNLDIPSLLTKELRRPHPSPALGKKLIHAVRYLPEDQKLEALRVLASKLSILGPLFPPVAVMLSDVLPSIYPDAEFIYSELRKSVLSDTYLWSLPATLAYWVRVMAMDPHPTTTEIMIRLFDSTSSEMVRRDVILAMARRNSAHWFRGLFGRTGLPPGERRALLAAAMGTEGGDSWRKSIRVSPFDDLIARWAEEQRAANSNWCPPF
jgi:hypothetical protein